MRSATIGGLVAAAAVGTAGVPTTPAAERTPTLTVTFLPAGPSMTERTVPTPIRIRNLGPGRAVAVTLRVSAPSWVTLARPGCTHNSTSLICSLRPLPEGATVTARIGVTPRHAGTYRLTAQASATWPSPPPALLKRATAATQPFRSSIAPISSARARRMTGVSWRAGCPLALADLRVVTVSFWGFDGRPHTGTLIVNRTVAAQVARVLGRLYAVRFPIRRMSPVDAYGGDDYRSIDDDNTSAFNCRPATGSTHWSEHAYGRAIDLDPLENPYVSGGKTSHPASRRYLDRSLRLPGMIHAGDAVVRAFAAEGWGWGGLWNGTRDYQHFSSSGR